MTILTTSRLKALPKAEVHVHLEGTFEAKTLEQWARQSGISMPRPREQLFQFNGLADFLHFLDWASSLADSRERLAALARNFCERLQRDGTGYADIIFNPTHWGKWRHRLPEMLDALDAGFSEAEQDGLPPVGLCVSLLRTQTAQEATELVEMLTSLRHRRVVGLSVDGNEATAGRTGPRFADAFRQAANAGLKKTVHAGESSGAEGVRDAIELLQADRIDHGVRAIEDAAVIDLLVQRQIPIGVCPTSNIVLKVFPSMDVHPLERLRKSGVLLSINTDDPSLLSTDLVQEYGLAAKQFGWHEETVRSIAHTSIEACFANEDIKRSLLSSLKDW